MIPKDAIFYWEGPEMSWLRSQSIETFKKLNPSWSVRVIDGEGIPITGDSRVRVVGRSDWARYRELHRFGGVYFDTDIIFCKPIPDEWLEKDLILTLSDERFIDHVAVLGSECGNAFFKLMDRACEISYQEGTAFDYQHFGVQMTNRMSDSLHTKNVEWLHPSVFIPIKYFNVSALWREGGEVPHLTYGVHWYGGDWTSVSEEKVVDEKWAKSSTSMIARAWRMAMGSQISDQEALCEQHGIQ